MTIVIPMAGRGQRFVDAGYRVPKMLIEAHGKSLLQWSVDSLPLHLCKRLVFIGLAEHEKDFSLSTPIRQWYGGGPRLDFVFLPEVTGGQAQTVLAARKSIPTEEPLLIFNIDTAFHSSTLVRTLTAPNNDGVLGAFASREPRFSFAAVDGTGVVTRVTEKEPISEHALTGLYHYRRAGDFLAVADDAVKKDARVKGEFYVAPLYNSLITEGRRFTLDHCRAHYILGTPAELQAFLALPAEEVRRQLAQKS
jgi:dTDP-glucose pyrophosphorylase